MVEVGFGEAGGGNVQWRAVRGARGKRRLESSNGKIRIAVHARRCHARDKPKSNDAIAFCSTENCAD